MFLRDKARWEHLAARVGVPHEGNREAPSQAHPPPLAPTGPQPCIMPK